MSAHVTTMPRHSLATSASNNARFMQWQDQQVVEQYAPAPVEARQQAQELGLCDLSVLARCGFKGRGTPEWLAAQGREIPADVNRACRQATGALIARLSVDEHLIMTNPWHPTFRFDAPDPGDSTPGVYALPRQHSHAWFFLSGRQAPQLMSHVCGVDLRAHKFAPLGIAQTTVATLNAVVIADEVGQLRGMHLLCDQTAADWFWQALVDAMVVLGGRPVGVKAMAELAGEAARN